MDSLKNLKHERMAQLLADGKTQMEAYAGAGFGGSPKAHASNTYNRYPDIQARVATILDERRRVIDEGRAKAVEEAAVDKAWVLRNLKDVVERCLQARPVMQGGKPVMIDTPNGEIAPAYVFQPQGANKALELIGKELGMFVERSEVGKPGEFAELDDKELDEELARVEARGLIERVADRSAKGDRGRKGRTTV